MDKAGCRFGVASVVAVPPHTGANVRLEPAVVSPPAVDGPVPRSARVAGRLRGCAGRVMVAPEIGMGHP